MVSEDIAARVTSYIRHQGTKPPEALIELVSTSQGRLMDVFGGVSEDVASKKPALEEWSLRELIRHVIDAEDSVAGLVRTLSRGQPPEKRGGAGMMPDDDGRPFGEYVAQLREVNARMIESVRTLPAPPDLAAKAPHPFFGPLNCTEWAAFQRVHDEDHAQHAKKIIEAVSHA